MMHENSDSVLPQPRIIPRAEHNISRKNISLEALKVLYRLHHAGYKAYLVGGGVRDLLLGKRPKDFDVVTDARPGEIRKLFRNSRIIGRRFRLVQVFFRGGKIVEVSTFRCRSEFDAGPEETLPRNNTYGTPAEDAHRRDITINALFYNIADFSLVDYVGGLRDLKEGYIRVIGEPGLRYVRDPVRMIRVLRHAARTGFRIDPEAWEQIKVKKDLIRVCPPARLRDEFLKDLKSGAARPFIKLLLESGLFFSLFPAWENLEGAEWQEELQDHLSRLDLLMAREIPLSENLLWAMFLLPYLRRQALPENPGELRAAISRHIREALGVMEIARQRLEEMSQILALARTLQTQKERGRGRISRLMRLAAYPEARQLLRLAKAPLEELPSFFSSQEAASPPAPKRRRPRRRRPRGVPRRVANR